MFHHFAAKDTKLDFALVWEFYITPVKIYKIIFFFRKNEIELMKLHAFGCILSLYFNTLL